jgi:hypothetical protein
MEDAMGSPALFDTVPAKRQLDLYDGDGINTKKVFDFLKFTKEEVAQASGVALGSVRYDQRLPAELSRYGMELAAAFELVAVHFKGDVAKTNLWFNARNPMLGDLSPRDMIRLGRFTKLQAFILNARKGNRA